MRSLDAISHLAAKKTVALSDQLAQRVVKTFRARNGFNTSLGPESARPKLLSSPRNSKIVAGPGCCCPGQ